MATVAQALEYYDQGQEKYAELFNTIKYYKVTIINSDQTHSKIVLYDADMKIVFESEYELVGELAKNKWSWSWLFANYTKKSTYLMRKVLMYALDLTQDTTLPESLELKHLLLNNNNDILTYITLEIFIALYSYLLKMPLIIPIVYDPRGWEEITLWNKLSPVEIMQLDNSKTLMFFNLLNYKDYDTNLSRANPRGVSSVHA